MKRPLGHWPPVVRRHPSCSARWRRCRPRSRLDDSEAGISNWSLDPAGLTYPGVAPCAIPDGKQRISTGGNTLTG